MRLVRRLLQHLPIVLFVSMATGWTYVRFKPFDCVVFGGGFDFRILSLLLPLVAFAIVVLTFRYGSVFCSWFCPTHLYLEGARAVAAQKGHLWRLAKIGFPLLASTGVTFALVTCFVPFSVQVALFREQGLSARFCVVGLAMLIWFVVHLGLLHWRFCVYMCPYGILMRLFKTDQTPVMAFDENSGRCVNCRACDRVCPYELDVRRQCDGDLCSNCKCCVDACGNVLGSDNAVLSIQRDAV
jgi:ferredoxin-type protein NapH